VLEESNEALVSKNRALEESTRALMSKNQVLEDSNEALVSKNRMLEESKETLMSKNRLLEETNEALVSNNEKLHADVDAHKNQIDQHLTSSRDMAASNEEMTQRVANLEAKLALFEAENLRLSVRVQEVSLPGLVA
jgi:hypothetical protein